MIVKHIIILFTLVLMPCLQSCNYNPFKSKYLSCDYSSSSKYKSKEIKKLISSKQTKNIIIDSLINEIIEKIRLPYKEFEIVYDNTGDIKVASAKIENNGARYIIINENAFNNINSRSTKEFASVIGVLSHELAHLTYSHRASNHYNELLADRYAGWVLNKLGVARGYCPEGLETIPQRDRKGSKTHPPHNQRQNEMLFGWDKAQAQPGSSTDYSICCDTSNYSSFTIEGLVLQNAINEGNSSFIDLTISLHDEKGKLIQEFDKIKLDNLKIRPETVYPIRLFHGLNFVIRNKKFYSLRIVVCKCVEPCEGNLRRDCPTNTELLLKQLKKSNTIPFDNYGYLEIHFNK